MHIRRILLEWFFALAQRHGKAVLAAMAGLTLVLACLIPRLAIVSSYQDLVSPDQPEQARFRAFLREFGASEDLVLVLEGEPEILKANAENFAREVLREENLVKSVFYRVEVDRLLESAPLYAPREALRETADAVLREQALVGRVFALRNLPQLLDLIGENLAGEPPEGGTDPARAAAALRGMALLFEEWRRWLIEDGKDRIDFIALLGEEGRPELSLLRSGGYLVSRNQRMLFLFIRPRNPSDEISALKPFAGAVRSAVSRVFDRHPELKGSVKTALTGLPAHALTEVETIHADIARSAAVSILLVLAILFAGFRSPKKILIACIPLACGMVMTAGLITLILGRLNLISSSFLAVLFGIGIDFSIYLTRRTAEELGYGRSREQAVHTAVTESGKSILTGGLTTGFAFLAVAGCDFAGFSELGVAAGMGVLVILACTFLMLPALLLRVRITPQRYQVHRVVQESRHGRHRALLYLIAFFAAGTAGFGAWAATRLKCDFNALKLLPADSESTVYQLRMQNESDFQMTAAAVTAGSLEEMRSQVGKIRALPLVGRVESLSDLVPEEQEEKIALIARTRPVLGDASISFSPADYGVDDLSARLDRIAEGLARAEETAFAAGQAGVVEAIETNLAALSGVSAALRDETGPRAREKTLAFEKALFAALADGSRLVRDWLQAVPVAEGSLAPDLLSRFKSPRGSYVAYVFPNGPIWEIDFLDRFVAGLKAVAPAATGFPVTHRETSHLLVESLLKALAYALLMIVILLALDFRRLVPVLLALIPLSLGMLWTQAVMYLLGRSYDFASLPALPLVLGLGIVYGVHIVDRWMEHPRITAFAATLTSGEGVALAALTTLAGLAGLLFSRHRGVESFGIILIIGIASSMLAALYVLPAVIDLVYLGGKRKHPERPGREIPEQNHE